MRLTATSLRWVHAGGRGALRWLARPVRLVGAVAALFLALIAAIFFIPGEGEVRYSGVARLEFPLPDVGGEPGAVAAGERHLAALVEPAAASRPGPVDPGLVEDGRYGPLPRVGPDGRRPAVVYARPFYPSDRGPKVAIVLAGLGLQSDITRAALALPGPVTLHFSPYAPDLAKLIDAAHRAGHEVLLDLPMEPSDYPQSDPGPHTLLAAASTEGNLDRLLWLLARSPGYFGVSGAGGRFARSAQAVATLDVLAKRGLALVELGSAELQQAAEEVGLPYAQTGLPIDDVPSARAIDFALAALESEALETGAALGLAQTYPITIERLRRWIATLAEKNLLLAPASALVLGRADRAADVKGDDDPLDTDHG